MAKRPAMIVLDTNIISEADRTGPSESVIEWFWHQDPLVLHLCAPVLMEQAYGAERFKLRTGSDRYNKTLSRVIERFSGRVLEFVDPAPEVAGRLRARRESVGRALSTQDSMIAALCIVHGATLATRNVRDFEGLDLRLVNPFESTPRTTR